MAYETLRAQYESVQSQVVLVLGMLLLFLSFLVEYCDVNYTILLSVFDQSLSLFLIQLRERDAILQSSESKVVIVSSPRGALIL